LHSPGIHGVSILPCLPCIYQDLTNSVLRTLTIKGAQIAWVSTQSPTRGSASVKLDSGSAKTINTHTSSPKTAEIVDVVSGAAGAHTLVVKVLGTSGHPRVDIDAFLVLGIAG